MQFKEAKQILNESGYRLVEDSIEIPVDSLENGKYIKRLMKLYNNSGYLYLYEVTTAVESDNPFYAISGDYCKIKVKVYLEIRDGKFNITIYGLDETEGYDWVEVGNGVSNSFNDAAKQALTESKPNLEILFNKIHFQK